MMYANYPPAKDYKNSYYGNCRKFFKDFPELDSSLSFNPRVNIYENSNQFNFEIELPGVKKDDLKVVYQDEFLIISGEKKDLSKNGLENKILKNERYFGNFKRSFRLTGGINPNKIEAKFEDGILFVSVAKVEDNTTKVKSIEIK